MNLYNRDYSKSSTLENTRSSELSVFIKQTCQLLAASLLATTAGAYIGIFTSAQSFMQSQITLWILFTVELGLLFGLMYKKKEAPLNLILLFAFTFVLRLTPTPLLISVLVLPAGGVVVAQAFALTTVAFGGLSIFAMDTKKDFTMMGKALFIVLIVVVATSLLNLFSQSSILNLAVSAVATILFSFYILYDTQNIIHENYETPIEGAVALYLDSVNLFTSLLGILKSFSSR